METSLSNLNFRGVSDIPKDELKTINGGNPVIWFFFGVVFGGIEDFNAGYAEAKQR